MVNGNPAVTTGTETNMAKNPNQTSAPKATAATEPKRLRVIPSDETFSRSIEVDAPAKAVTCRYAVKTSKESTRRYEIETTLDFSSCSPEDILRLAADTAIISVQRMWRVTAAGKEAEQAYVADRWSKVDVKADILEVERSRGPVDPVLATRRNLEKMGLTAEQVAAIMADVTAKAAAATK